MHLLLLFPLLLLQLLASSPSSAAAFRPLSPSNTNNNKAVWDPEQQIYVGGVIPNHNEAAVDEYLNSGMTLRIFGYGSLCWGPGTGALAKDGVTTKLGRAIGYKRCWAQKSTDHRGFPSFPGIVCTLLRDEEVKDIREQLQASDTGLDDRPSMTEGVVYTIPPEQAADCLAELDFREKGGYARDVVEVLIDGDVEGTTTTVKALLYRGTTNNPAFWNRALLDLPLAAAVMSVSIGPSGPNDAYLFNLDDFMSDPKTISNDGVTVDKYHGDTDTSYLASMAKEFQKQQLYFLVGCGSNQHNQLRLQSERNSAGLVNGAEDAHDLKEIVLCTADLRDGEQQVKQLAAGGGHSALLTEAGALYLWGWNEASQLGRNSDEDESKASSDPLPVIPKLGIAVDRVALGFSHTVIIEKGTGCLYAFGSNARGQVDASATGTAEAMAVPTLLYADKRFVDIAAGLFHSAAITEDGDLITFGCSRFGQAMADSQPWRPSDGSRLTKVACGRRHTIALDEHGRIWTMGENKYGQLGRRLPLGEKKSTTPQVVDGVLGQKDSGCVDIACGWSHCVVSVVVNKEYDAATRTTVRLFGWGRNDKGQLGLGSTDNISSPTAMFDDMSIVSFCCGSESSVVVDTCDNVWGCGWNEHGNIGTGDDEDCLTLKQMSGARILAPPPSDGRGEVVVATGGAHVLVMRKM